MNELQLALLALGGAAVGTVFGYNAWQARRHRKLAERLLQRDGGDVLVEPPSPQASEKVPPRMPAEPAPAARGERVEPTLPESLKPAAAPSENPFSEAGASDAHERSVAPEPQAETVAVAEAAIADDLPPEVALPPALLSPMIDDLAAFEAIEPVAGDQILAHQGELLRSLGKRVAWVGYDEVEQAWEYCRPDAAYRRIRIGLQLADRQGPISPAALDGFREAMQRFADEITAVVDLAPKTVVLENAQRLDQICAGVDIQVGVNVVSRGVPFSGTKIRALAESTGMEMGPGGVYVRRDEDGRLLYTLLAHEGGFTPESVRTMATHGLTFLLDVPKVGNGDRVFNQMVEVARRFADTLQGDFVDDNRRPITEQFLAPIRKQIGQYQGAMAGHGLPAGSDLVQRLFS